MIHRDCFAYDKPHKCNAMGDLLCESRACPFYKSAKTERKELMALYGVKTVTEAIQKYRAEKESR